MSRRAPKVLAKTKGRSRLSNGHALPTGIDLREKWPRRFRDLLIIHSNDLGGADNLSQAEASILRRAVTLAVELEIMEEKFALAGGASLEELTVYQQASNTMRRHLQALGLKRRARDMTPNLQTYLRSRHEAAE